MATNKPLCRYYMHGACDKGLDCSFAHDFSVAPSMVCRYYQQGQCRYGDRCRYDHIRHPSKKNCTQDLSTQINASKVHHSQTNDLLDKRKSSVPSNHLNANAAEFFPIAKISSHQDSLQTHQKGGQANNVGCTKGAASSQMLRDCDLLCPYALQGGCVYGDACAYTHGEFCELCGLAALHPTDKKQRELHIDECQKALEKDMELSFRFAQSEKKECGICMDIITEKEPPHERKFGILSNCNHVFCLACIRKWRKEKSFDSKAIRSCPECRTVSDFVTPSDYWVELREEKEKLIEGYKAALKNKPCQYFKKGQGECPFNEHCFYQHAYPNGTLASPKPRRRRQNVSGDLHSFDEVLLWDFLEERENIVIQALEDEFTEQLLHAISVHLSISSDDTDTDTDSD